jgi:hypothetical protein
VTRDRKVYRLAYWIASVVLAAVLLSGFQKLLYPADFALAVYRFHLLPDALVNVTALYLPWLEAACALCLVCIPRYRTAALWIVMALLVLFTAGIVVNLLRGTAFGCGCFSRSPLAPPMGGLSVARNAALLLLAILALYGRKKADL